MCRQNFREGIGTSTLLTRVTNEVVTFSQLSPRERTFPLNFGSRRKHENNHHIMELDGE